MQDHTRGIAASIEHADLRTLGVYLEQLSEGRRLPRPQDFDITRVPRLAGFIHMIDVVPGPPALDRPAPPRFRFAVYGTRIGELTGSHFQGYWIDEVEPPERRERLLSRLNRIAAEGRPIYEPLAECPALRGRPDIEPRVHLLSWPMSRDGRRIDRILLGIATADEARLPG